MAQELNWQSIDTAPKDGSVVLIASSFRVGESSFGVCKPQPDGYKANAGQECWRTWDKVFVFPGSITHWMPLPDPPK